MNDEQQTKAKLPKTSLSSEQEVAALTQLQESKERTLAGHNMHDIVSGIFAAKKAKNEDDGRSGYQRHIDVGGLWRSSDVPLRHRDKAREMIETASGKWGDTMEDLTRKLPAGFLIALLGKRGTGKTQLAVCLIQNACRGGLSARYIKAMDLFRELRSCYRKDGDDEIKLVNKFIRYDLLVIDEAHERSDSEWENRTLTNIIDHRYDANHSTLLISNQTKEGFATSVSQSIVSRIHETGGAIDCDWDSYRKAGAQS